MFKFLIILLVFISSCSTNKVISNHGSSFIQEKSNNLVVNQSNKNDIIEILGPPSSISSFDENIFIYIERKKVSTSIFKLGKRKIEKNNVLLAEFSNDGILKKKNFYKLEDMNNIEFSKSITQAGYSRNSYIYNVLTSLRQKINAPITRKKQSED